ncbi:hypothetical protein [Corynebacterium phoceense]|uniref:DUF7426 family protein n=1 Tax=Corynebacterium phoceense TaxID=1686286 RepID=UPI0018AA0372|nr:hypothetical protein [Corynebacterium phoceense]MBF9011284.1 hypothetical protein [Corynebacterium phoceense]
MTDFGQLDEQLEEYDIRFEFKGKEYTVTPSVHDVLAYHRDRASSYAKLQKDPNSDSFGMWRRVSPLLGSKFIAKSGKFEGGIFEEIIEAGASFAQVERLANAIDLKYSSSDALAKAYFETGELGKALDKVKNDTQPSQETQKAAGETNGDA